MKNFKLYECEDFEPNLIKRHGIYEGVQYIFRFDNDYGASVVKHGGSYGYHVDMWELAVIRFKNSSNDSWDLTYDTPITDDVIGFLNDEEVRDLLKKIKGL